MGFSVSLFFFGRSGGGFLSEAEGPPPSVLRQATLRSVSVAPNAARSAALVAINVALLLFGAAFFSGNTACAFELLNWRLPYVKVATLFDSVSSSPSGMFWDDLEGHGVVGKGVWPDSSWNHRDYWHVEPAVGLTTSNQNFVDGHPYFGHGGLTSDLRFGKLLVRERLDVDTRYKNDSDYVWKKDRVAAGRVEEAYVQYTGKIGFVRFGRLARNWGPFVDRSVILSDNPHTYDALEWQVKGPFFEFRQLFSAFPYELSQLDINDTIKTNRYLSAHSLNFFYKDWVGAGVTEAMLFGRQSGLPDFQFLNPFSIYTVINTNTEGSGNLMLGFQGWAHPFVRNVTLKGQVIIDDIQVDHKTVGDSEPNHWGGDFGIYWRPVLPIQSALSLEYHYLSKWIYLVSSNNVAVGERYTLYGRGLGYPENDGDRWHLGYTVAGKDLWFASADLAYQRRGGNTVKSPWNTAAGWNGYTVEHSLRSDSCENTIEASLSGIGYFRGYANIGATITNRWIKNRNNVRSSTFVYDPVFSVSVSMEYPSFYWQFSDRTSR